MLDFFSLGETFLGIGMRLGGGIMQFKMFGNLAHPSATYYLTAQRRMDLKKLGGVQIPLAATFYFSTKKMNMVYFHAQICQKGIKYI